MKKRPAAAIAAAAALFLGLAACTVDPGGDPGASPGAHGPSDRTVRIGMYLPETVADNFAWHQDPANESVHVGLGLGGSIDFTVEADAETGNVTLHLAEPNSAFLHFMHFLPMVCEAGLQDAASLTDMTVGTGAYVLESAEPGVKYVYTRRDGYTWGPNGVTSADAGFPAKIELIGISDDETAIGQFLAGELDLVNIAGAESKQRIADVPGLTMSPASNMLPLLLFNEHDRRRRTRR